MNEDKLKIELDNWHKTLRGESAPGEATDEDEKRFAESIRRYMLHRQPQTAPEGQKEKTWTLIQEKIKDNEKSTTYPEPNAFSKILDLIFKPSNLALALSFCAIALIIPVLMQDKTDDEIVAYVTKGASKTISTENSDTKGLVSEYVLPQNEVLQLYSDLQKIKVIPDEVEPFYRLYFLLPNATERTLNFDKETSQSDEVMNILSRYEIIYFDKTMPQNFKFSFE